MQRQLCESVVSLIATYDWSIWSARLRYKNLPLLGPDKLLLLLHIKATSNRYR
jgi:hypothetical protein